jgi:hypothetical protein
MEDYVSQVCQIAELPVGQLLLVFTLNESNNRERQLLRSIELPFVRCYFSECRGVNRLTSTLANATR